MKRDDISLYCKIYIYNNISTLVMRRVYPILLKGIGFRLCFEGPSSGWKPPSRLVYRSLRCPPYAPGYPGICARRSEVQSQQHSFFSLHY